MLIVATIRNIVPKKAKKDQSLYRLSENESYNLIQIHKLEQIIGFEDDEIVFKNYANI